MARKICSTTESAPDETPIHPPQRGHVRVVPLGGVGEFGKNCTVIEYGDDLFVIDCGLKFPEDEMLGIDFVVPDFTYVQQSADRLRGVILTHGHEDHIGAVPYFVRHLGLECVKVYASRLTIELVKAKLEELDVLSMVDLEVIEPFERRTIGSVQFEFLPVTHSIPMAFAVAMYTPEGVVLHTGDFKFDPDGSDESGTLRRFADRMGPGRVMLLLADSTNADREGVSPQEQVVREGLRECGRRRAHRDPRGLQQQPAPRADGD